MPVTVGQILVVYSVSIKYTVYVILAVQKDQNKSKEQSCRSYADTMGMKLQMK